MYVPGATAMVVENLKVRLRLVEPTVDIVIPVGSPEAARATCPPKVPIGVIEMVDVADPPRLRVRVLGEKAKVKLGAASRSVRVVLAVATPEVPVMVTV